MAHGDLNSEEFIERTALLASQTFGPNTPWDPKWKQVVRAVLDALPEGTVDLRLTKRAYDPTHDKGALCASCGHSYVRHFDTYDDMYPIGCKYCSCPAFVGAVVRPL